MSGRDKAQGVSSHSTASASVPTVAAQTSNTPVKRLCVEGKPHIESLDRPATLPISSQRMDLSDAPARVRFALHCDYMH